MTAASASPSVGLRWPLPRPNLRSSTVNAQSAPDCSYALYYCCGARYGSSPKGRSPATVRCRMKGSSFRLENGLFGTCRLAPMRRRSSRSILC